MRYATYDQLLRDERDELGAILASSTEECFANELPKVMAQTHGRDFDDIEEGFHLLFTEIFQSIAASNHKWAGLDKVFRPTNKWSFQFLTRLAKLFIMKLPYTGSRQEYPWGMGFKPLTEAIESSSKESNEIPCPLEFYQLVFLEEGVKVDYARYQLHHTIFEILSNNCTGFSPPTSSDTVFHHWQMEVLNKVVDIEYFASQENQDAYLRLAKERDCTEGNPISTVLTISDGTRQ